MSDVGTQQLYQCLLAALDPSPQTRKAAEAALEAGAKQSGFGTTLLQLVLMQEVPYGIRQLAAVVLKKYVKEHWTHESPHFREPPVEEGEKAAIREMLPRGLADPNSKLRTAVGMAVAGIAKWDCPQQWPGLLPGLVHAITAKKDLNMVNGAVRCLSMFVDELGEEQVLELAPTLLPELLLIVRTDEYGPGLQRRAISILHCVVGVLHMLTCSHLKEVKALVEAVAGGWFGEFARLLAKPLGTNDVGGWGVKMECLKVMIQLVSAFSKLCAPHLPAAMALSWQLFVQSMPVYQALVIEGDDDAGEVDSEGDSIDLESLLSQLMEFILTLIGKKRYQAGIKASMAELQYHTLGYMQMTSSQVEQWSADPNQYVAQDDDFASVRATGEMILDELVEAFEGDALTTFGAALQRRLQEGAVAKAAGREDWWRLREACLLAVGALADRLVQQQQGVGGRGRRGSLDVAGLLESILVEDLAAADVPPFLLGRALWATSRLSPLIPPARQGAFLQAAVLRLGPGNPTPVQIGACKAVAGLCKGAGAAEVQAASQQMFAGLSHLLGVSSDEVLHLVIETLTEVVKADPAGAAQWEPHISPPVLAAWVAHVNDPLLSEDATDLLSVLAALPACLPSLQARMLPSLGTIISSPAQHPSLLVSGSVDMVTLLLTPSPPEVAQQIHAAATPHILALAMGSDDADVLQSATAYLRTLLQVGGPAALSWGGAAPEASLAALLQPVRRLLEPGLGDSASYYVGTLVLELLRRAGDPLAPSLPGILAALARKLAAVDNSSLVQSLLMVVAHLVHANLAQTVECLAGMQLPDGRSALEVVMTKWTERQIEVRTPYAIKMTTTALAALLASQHPALQQLQVKGKRMDTESGVRTRTRARLQAEQWSSVALPVKIAMLLTDAYIEATTQGEEADGDDDSEGDWEEGASDEEEDMGRDFLGVAGQPFTGIGVLLECDAESEELADVDPLEARRREGDPLARLQLAPFLQQCFQAAAAAQPGLMQALGAQLTPTQAAALAPVFQQQ